MVDVGWMYDGWVGCKHGPANIAERYLDFCGPTSKINIID